MVKNYRSLSKRIVIWEILMGILLLIVYLGLTPVIVGIYLLIFIVSCLLWGLGMIFSVFLFRMIKTIQVTPEN